MPQLSDEAARRLGVLPPSRIVTPVAGLIVDHHKVGLMASTSSGARVSAHVSISGNEGAIRLMTPDDADRLADELHAAAKAARGEDQVAMPADPRAP